ncbi:MAG TPA: exodeoxyribonuclease VII small subunit [Ignavibacteria bacterium]|nr:exodeoxyribonuclease VII small subunit [Ignavibacteria bacterium]
MAKTSENENFEFNYKKLEKIMSKLESEIDETSLDELMKNYQEGLKLINICRQKLKEAELKIEKINSEYNI